MVLNEALALFPEESPYRAIIAKLVSPDRTVRRQGKKDIEAHGLVAPYWVDPEPKQESVAVAVLRVAMDLEFPVPTHRGEDGARELVFTLLGSVYPSVIQLVEGGFATVPDGLRLELLTLLASGATPAGAEALTRLVEAHGWPEQLHGRFETELAKNLPHAEAAPRRKSPVRAASRCGACHVRQA